MRKMLLCGIAVLLMAGWAMAETVTVPINLVTAEGVGKEIGKITLEDTKSGLSITPELSGLPAGVRGFHVHENGTCDAAKKDDKMTAAQAAGGHLDPDKTGKHEGPSGKGHLGDLPPLTVGQDGKATTAVVAPRLKTSDLKGHAIMIHAGGDNFSDSPEPLGGGGGRIACGVVK